MIIQGNNSPIVIRFEETIQVSDMKDISAVLCKHISNLVSNKVNIVKHWEFKDAVIDTEANTVSLPLTQNETMLLEPGTLTVEFKWLDGNGYVNNLALFELEVVARCDETVLEASKS